MKKTRLYPCYAETDARMIDFFGWRLPVEFSGIVSEHLAVRKKAGLFDVSHMGEIIIKGKQALDLIQFLTPNDASRLSPGRAQYSALTTSEGTFVDDLLVYRLEEEVFLLVVNAANISKDYNWVLEHAGPFSVDVKNASDDYSQMALQGPDAKEILQPLTQIELGSLSSFHFVIGELAGQECLVSRTGYTGEDGFEIYTKCSDPGKIWKSIMEVGKGRGLLPIGLGARDTLRLEACLMLYGNDIDETTTVLEADLGWLIKFKKGDFLGRESLLMQKEKGVSRKIAGFELIERGIARSGYRVFVDGDQVSEVNSGTYSPFLKKSIGLAYLPLSHIEPGTEIQVKVHEHLIRGRIVPTPFYKREKNNSERK